MENELELLALGIFISVHMGYWLFALLKWFDKKENSNERNCNQED